MRSPTEVAEGAPLEKSAMRLLSAVSAGICAAEFMLSASSEALSLVAEHVAHERVGDVARTDTVGTGGNGRLDRLNFFGTHIGHRGCIAGERGCAAQMRLVAVRRRLRNA